MKQFLLHRKISGSFFCALVITVLISTIHARYLYRDARSFSLQVSMSSSVSDYTQFYYDTGKGLSERESVRSAVEGDNQFHIYNLSLPLIPIKNFRFDPLKTSGTVSIKKISVVNGFGKSVSSIDLHTLRPTNQIKAFDFKGNVLNVTIEDNACDPQIFMPLHSPLKLDTFQYFTVLPFASRLFGGFLIFFLSTCFLIWILGRQGVLVGFFDHPVEIIKKLKVSMERQNWVDSAKAIGIFLVFYGHFVESIYKSGSIIAFEQFKIIYSFHIPLFFFLSGFFGKKSPDFILEFKKLFLRRILPVISFAILSFPIWVGYMYLRNDLSYYKLTWMALSYFKGHPIFDVNTWFLICLFTCEIYATLIFSKFKSLKKLIIIAVFSLLGGLFLCENMDVFSRISGIAPNTWYIHEGIVALGFYLTGYIIYPVIKQLNKIKYTLICVILGIISLIVLVFSYNLNSPTKGFVVLMINSSHGYIIPFLISAFAGILFIICISSLMPSFKPVLFIGQNTLILLGLSGIYFNFINYKIVSSFPPDNNWVSITIYCILFSIISIISCIPFVIIFNKWMPQLMGKSNKDGPIIQKLENI